MEERNVFINKKEIDKLFEEEKYRNCMEKKYFEYIVSMGKIEYIDKYLKHSKNKKIIESMVFTNKVVKIIDKLSVKLENHKYVGELEGSGISNIEISQEIVKKCHDQILTKGIFCLINLEENIDDKYSYYIEEIEILEDIDVNLDEYKEYFGEQIKICKEERKKQLLLGSGKKLTKQEFYSIGGVDLVLNTFGISTENFTFWEKIIYLVRLIPLCEANYNLMELGGNGIGKTKTYSMFSPECEIVQEMTITGLIYNIQTKTDGSLATKDVIVFDEIDKIKLDADKEKIIPQLLNYMADGQTTSPRKVISKASLVFSGNVMGIQERIEKDEKNIFDKPHKFEDNAFLDRIHFFLPAWGLRRYSKNIHSENIEKKVFRFDYFSKVLNLLRNEDYSKIIDEKGYTIENGSEREIKAIRKTVSGLIKLTHPDKKIDNLTLEAYIAIAIKGRGLINKFLNNKNKNNVNKINVELIFENRREKEKIFLNESLKHLIYEDNLITIDKYYEEIEKKFKIKSPERYVNMKTYGDYFNEYDLNIYEEYVRNFENDVFYEGRFYPNRHIVVFNDTRNTSNIIILKIALDKLGIEKNKREEQLLKKIYKDAIKIKLSDKGKCLIFINEKGFNEDSYDLNIDKNILFDNEEINYDVLFGDDSLDLNNFTGRSLKECTDLVELDLSNVYFIDKDRKLKLENGEYIVPKFKYDIDVNKYFYEEAMKRRREGELVSEKMTYVEFKYFLEKNGFIKLNDTNSKE